MRLGTIAGVAAGFLSLQADVPAQQPMLQLQGLPYSGGGMTLHVTAPADVGDIVWLGVGLDPLPLDAPVPTNKGPWFVGNLLTSLLVGTIQSDGRLDMPFTMPPPTPGTEGIAIALQAYVPPALSNPATLNLDEPYLLPSNAVAIDHPMPSQGANFGDKVAAGDFNDDGVMDLAVGAWFEDIGGAGKAGRVYMMWGPDFKAFTVLSPAVPAYLLHFGQGLAVADFDLDGVDDLAVGEGTGGDPPTVGAHGHVYIFRGSATFSTTPWATVTSAGTGQEAYVFGRVMRAGDIDGDMWPDLVLGATDATVQGKTKAGRLEIFLGPTWSMPLLVENPDPKTNDFFGSRVALGEVTADGILDIFEASGRAAYSGLSQAGVAHVYAGGGLALLQVLTAPTPTAGARFGEGLFTADPDSDGLAEAILADVKKHFFVAWNPLDTSSLDTWSKPPSPNPGADSSFGYFFSAADMNGDALIDVVIADPFEGDLSGCFGGNEGTIYVAVAPYFSTHYRLTSPFPNCGDEFSWNLATADLDGDGTQEIISGSDTADVGVFGNAGRVIISFP